MRSEIREEVVAWTISILAALGIFGILLAVWYLIYLSGHIDGEHKGRIDIASGRVTATLETQADGTSEWVFEEER